MSDMHLPANGSQDRLISAVAAVNPKTIVVNTTGVAVTAPWLSEVQVFLQAWYAGQETGNAILDVILGEVNPSGKLPISWPRDYEHTAVFGHFGLDSYESREVEYVEGVHVGYRHFDRHYGGEKQVLFPFGFGLSYSTFTISSPTLTGQLSSKSDDGITVSVEVENTGSKVGAEVVQIYLAPPVDHKTDRPLKSLVGFTKVFLGDGEKKTVSIHFRKDSAAMWDIDQRKWAVEAGLHEILIGTSSNPEDLKLRMKLEIPEAFVFDP